MGGHHSAARLLVGLTIGVLLGGCTSSAVTPPVPTAAPPPTPKPTTTQKPVAGWPTVSRVGITMTGAVDEDYWPLDGRLRLSITVTGLAPGEAVSLSAAGKYIIEWWCEAQPEPCGEGGCVPGFSGKTEGTATAAAQAVAGSDGAAAARIEFAAAPPAECFTTGSSARWGTSLERWERVSIADAVHGLLLTPETIERAVTYD